MPTITNTSGTLSITWTKGPGYPGVYGTDYLIDTTYTFPASGDRRFARLKVMVP
jgi:hypothetical protein